MRIVYTSRVSCYMSVFALVGPPAYPSRRESLLKLAAEPEIESSADWDEDHGSPRTIAHLKKKTLLIKQKFKQHDENTPPAPELPKRNYPSQPPNRVEPPATRVDPPKKRIDPLVFDPMKKSEPSKLETKYHELTAHMLKLQERYPGLVCVDSTGIIIYDTSLKTDVDDAINSVVQNCGGMKFHIGIIAITTVSGVGHGNSLISDMENKVMYRFEPHGVSLKLSAEMYDTDNLDMLLRTALSKLGWTYVPPNIVCPMIGPQSAQRDKKGFCGFWSLYVIDRWLAGSGKRTPNEIVEDILRNATPKQLDTLIRKFRMDIRLPSSYESRLQTVIEAIHTRIVIDIDEGILWRESIRVLNSLRTDDIDALVRAVLVRLSDLPIRDVLGNSDHMTRVVGAFLGREPDDSVHYTVAKTWLKRASEIGEADINECIFEKLMAMGEFRRSPMNNAEIQNAVKNVTNISRLPIKQVFIIDQAYNCGYSELRKYTESYKNVIKHMMTFMKQHPHFKIFNSYDENDNQVVFIANICNVTLDDDTLSTLLLEWFAFIVESSWGDVQKTSIRKFFFDSMTRHGWTTVKVNWA